MKMLLGLIVLIIMATSSFAAVCGDVNADNKLNLLDISYIINHLYRSGSEPNCGITYIGECGDVNGSGTLNLLDISYIIGYLYRGGPAPICPNQLAVLTTAAVSAITQTTAECGGTISSDGGATVTVRGVCWSTNPMPTIADSKTTDGAGIGSFTSSIINLTGNTPYYVRAYATNSVGTAYGTEVSFTTSPVLPVLTTTAVSNITQTTAQSGGTITSDGGAEVTVRGVCWSTNPMPTIADNKTTDGAGIGSFISSIASLTANTPYYVRAYATNSAGTGYGNILSFSTIPAILPVLTTAAVSAITQTTAECGGNITSDGGAEVIARGVCWSTNPTPTIADSKSTDGTGIGSFISSIINLGGNTPYYVRAYATNSVGTSYGNEVSFTTSPVLPVLTTAAVNAITQTTAQCGGNITSDGGAAVTVRGVCWSTNPIPTVADDTTNDGTGTGSFTSSIASLTANTPYYVRAYATNSAGTGYGNSVSFITDPGPVTDIDGNSYQTIKIGNQWWMAANLKVTHYRNGDAISHVADSLSWISLTIGAYCEYNNDVNNVATYGLLYNGHAVFDNRNIAPAGWHVPSDAEWQTLVNYLGGSSVAGGKMKEAGTTHWSSPNTGATNESGFSALPGGSRYGDFATADYVSMGYLAYFWSSTEYDSNFAWTRVLYYWQSDLNRDSHGKRYGQSVRCVRDY
jgi:uncharacterized protein (TIGR02145 family)